MDRKKRLEDLNLTNDELKRIGEAFKNEEFRKLFAEYAEEISNPENRRQYEAEIAQMEAERGMDVTFINPEPSYVLMTSVNGESKGFINICQNDKIDKPNCNRQTNADGKSGIMWNVPHSFSPPREDLDKGGQRCKIFDVVYHPDTLRMAFSNKRFKDLVESIALDGIERQFDVKLDRKNLKRPKLKYKGTPSATVIRSRKDEEKVSSQKKDDDDNDILKNMPYPYDNKTTAELADEKEKEIKKREEEQKQKAAKTKKQGEAEKPGFQVPKYTITHRSEMDIQEFRNAPDARPSTRPRELVVQIELPLLKSAASVNLDIFEQKLHLESAAPAAYQLDINLPYPVDDENGSAKFDKSKHCLLVTLPVIPAATPPMPSFIDDSVGTNGEPESGATETNSAPLIEVLSSSTDTPQTASEPKTNGHTDADNPAEESYPHIEANTKVYFSLPAYDIVQDAETLTFTFPISNVCAETAAKSFPAKNEMHVTFCSMGSGCFPIHYRLFASFPDYCAVAAEHCSLEVTGAKVTLLILKERSSRGLWEKFWAGLDKHTLEEKVFPAAKSVREEDSEQLGQQLGQAKREAEVTTTCGPSQLQEEGEEMTRKHRPRTKQAGQGEATRNEKGLTLEIKKREVTFRDEEDDEYDEPLSADIEVVYNGEQPKLHGILKQRSSSESSDEAACSPLTPTDDELSSSWNSQRKSVSFNHHVDSTTFKTNSSVSSMKTALKSKRRRVRKNEEKKRKAVERQRRNSGGSEGSGSEEPSPSDSFSCSEDGIPDDIDEEVEGGSGDEETVEAEEESAVEKGWAKAGVESEEMETIKARGEAEAKPSCKGTSSEGDAKILQKEEFRTSVVEAMSPGSKLAKDVKAKLAQGPSDEKEDDSDDDAEGDGAGTVGVEKKENPSQVKSKAAAQGDPSFYATGAISKPGDLQQMAQESGASIIHVTKAERTEGELGGGENVERSMHEKSDVETILSWDDPPALSDEHKTKCSVELQNAIMFDLDID